MKLGFELQFEEFEDKFYENSQVNSASQRYMNDTSKLW